VERGDAMNDFTKAGWEAMHMPMSYTAHTLHDDAA